MRRILEGALSAERTPVNPPAPTRLVSLTPQPKRPSPMQPAERAPAPPPPTPGLGRPETNRKEAWWERAITWLLSKGEGDHCNCRLTSGHRNPLYCPSHGPQRDEGER